MDGYDNFAWIQYYLNTYDTEGIWFDPYQRMKSLSPQCKEMLLHCMWEGEERDCDELFDLRATQEGFCCTFNYVRADAAHQIKGNVAPIKTKLYGVENGLQLLINSSQTDYYYPLLNQHGHSALFFHAHDYPDQASGYLEMRFIKPNVESMFELYPRTLVARESLRWFTPEQRDCYFADEPPGYGGFYSQSECLLDCRIRSFVALCDCVPFFIPRTRRNQLLGNDTQTCNLEHVSCLNKYQSKNGLGRDLR